MPTVDAGNLSGLGSPTQRFEMQFGGGLSRRLSQTHVFSFSIVHRVTKRALEKMRKGAGIGSGHSAIGFYDLTGEKQRKKG